MIALFCGLGVLLGGGFFVASRVLPSMAFRAEGEKLTARTPIGDLRVEKVNEVGPGLPIYPNASLVLPGHDTLAPAPKTSLAEVQTTTYHTNDIREIVDSWYVEHLGPEFVRRDAGNSVFSDAIRGAHISDDNIAFVAERGDQVRIVALTPDPIGTKITLLRFSKRNSP